MDWFDQRKRAERRETTWFVVNIIFWVILGLVVLRLVGGPW